MTKKILFIVTLTIAWSLPCRAQQEETEQLLINWEKLYLLEQMLDNMYTSYKILEKGYRTVKDISEGDYKLHQAFLDGLFAINPTVRNYRRIPLIIDYQKLLIKEYKRAYDRFRRDPHFTLAELQYVANVYSHLVQASVRNLDDLITIITATKLRMTDEERMQAIDRIFYDLEGKLGFLRAFNNNTQLLAIQRARNANDVKTIRLLYGIN